MTSYALMILDQTHSNLIDSEFIPVPKMKFNPGSKMLVEIINDLKFRIGAGISCFSNNNLSIGTGIKTETTLIDKVNSNATAVYQSMILPTMADYENLENLNDVESIENLLYQASKKFSW